MPFQRVTILREGEPGPTNRGFYCNKDGVFLGAGCALVWAERSALGKGEQYKVRDAYELNVLLQRAYGVAVDFNEIVPKLTAIARSLADGEITLAHFGTLFLGLPELPDQTAVERLRKVDALLKAGFKLKAGFNPDEPRDDQGRWTTEDGKEDQDDPQREHANPSDLAALFPLGLSPECQAEWSLALLRCNSLDNEGKLGPRSGFGATLHQCMRGFVTARCGGNPV